MKLLETIRMENGETENLRYHQKRFNSARKSLFNCKINIELGSIIQYNLKSEFNVGLFKCRIIYSKQINSVEFIPYSIPLIKSLKIVTDNQVDYSHKYFDRKPLENLYTKKEHCDDILIEKNGLITDTFYANILFYNGRNWLTPNHPLLNGTRRASLLEKEQIKTADIRPNDLHHFEKARLVNAMIRFEDCLDINIDKIIK